MVALRPLNTKRRQPLTALSNLKTSISVSSFNIFFAKLPIHHHYCLCSLHKPKSAVLSSAAVMSVHAQAITRQTRNALNLSTQLHARSLPLPPAKGACPSRSMSWVAPSRLLPPSNAADWPQPKPIGQNSRWRHARPVTISKRRLYNITPSRPYSSSSTSQAQAFEMTTASFKHIDPSSYEGKPWSKVDGPGTNFKQMDHTREVFNLRGREHEFTTDNSGFTVHNYPAKEKLFTDETAVREGYYQEVEDMLRDKIPGIKKVVIFDHTIRRRKKDSPRQPVQQV